MTAKPHEDPNCKCKACEAWAADLSPLLQAWEAEMASWEQYYFRVAAYFRITPPDGAKGQ